MRLDTELAGRYRLEPRSEREIATCDDIDAIDFSVYSAKLEIFCEEGKDVMVKTGISDMMQAGDCIVGIYTASGDLATACVGTCLHAATGQIPMKYILKYYKDDQTVGIHDGDIFFCNEAQLGGIHNPDQLNVIPMFWEGELIAWIAAASHEPETGATEPGGIPPTGRSRYDEGLKAPPIKVGEQFKLKSDLVALFANMVRDHRLIEVDQKARVAACFKVRDRLLRLLNDRGGDFVVGLIRRVAEAAAEGSRQVVREMLDGTFRQMMFFDNIGVSDGLGRISIVVIKSGDRITVDLRGCSPQTPSILNAPTHVVRAHMAAMLAMYLMPDMPCSSGMYEPFEFIAAEPGTCLNPDKEAAISAGVVLAPHCIQGLHACLNKMMFGTRLSERVAVPLGTGARVFAAGGVNQHGFYAVGTLASSMNANGGGGRPDRDGVDAAGFWWSGYGDCLDIEHDEMSRPHLYSMRMLATDQAGPGKFRGGAGAATNVIVHGSDSYYARVGGACWRFPTAIGQFGGYAGSCAPAVTVRGGKWHDALGRGDLENPRSFTELLQTRPVEGTYNLMSMGPGETYGPGDSIGVTAVAGGGYGDPLERAPDAVAEDVRRGIYTDWTAEHVYGVVLDPDLLTVDRDQTDALRSRHRQDRLERGRPYAEFVAEWEQLVPPADALAFYGTWPDARPPATPSRK